MDWGPSLNLIKYKFDSSKTRNQEILFFIRSLRMHFLFLFLCAKYFLSFLLTFLNQKNTFLTEEMQ